MEGWHSLRAEEDEFRAYRLEARADLVRDQEEIARDRQRLEDERDALRKERERNENSWSRKNNWNWADMITRTELELNCSWTGTELDFNCNHTWHLNVLQYWHFWQTMNFFGKFSKQSLTPSPPPSNLFFWNFSPYCYTLDFLVFLSDISSMNWLCNWRWFIALFYFLFFDVCPDASSIMYLIVKTYEA